MDMKILLSLMVVGIAALGIGMGTMAYFSDAETSAITVTSGTVDLQLSEDSGSTWHNGLSFDLPNDWAPGDTYSMEIWTKNMGRSGLKNLFVTGDNLGGTGGLCDVIEITDVAYTDTSGWVHPAGGTYYGTTFGDDTQPFTLRELANGHSNDEYMKFCWGDCETEGDYLPANGGRVQKFYIEFTFNENAGNEYQDKTASFDLGFIGTDEPFTPVWTP